MRIVQDDCLASSDGRYASCDTMRGIIEIDANQPTDHKELSLLHEIIEAINRENELELEHNAIMVISNQLYQVIKDNKLHF